MSGLWKKEYEVNITDIDAQHKEYFAMLEKADTVLKKDSLSADDVFYIFNLVISLRTYGYRHFATEEMLMVTVKFPGFLDQLNQHDEFMTKINQARLEFLSLFKAFQLGDDNRQEVLKFSRELVNFVINWWQQHISHEDAKYAYFMKTKSEA